MDHEYCGLTCSLLVRGSRPSGCRVAAGFGGRIERKGEEAGRASSHWIFLRRFQLDRSSRAAAPMAQGATPQRSILRGTNLGKAPEFFTARKLVQRRWRRRNVRRAAWSAGGLEARCVRGHRDAESALRERVPGEREAVIGIETLQETLDNRRPLRPCRGVSSLPLAARFTLRTRR